MARKTPDKAFYTTKEVAEVMGVTAPTVIKWVDSERVKAMKTPGGHRRISHAELLRLANEAGRVMGRKNETPTLRVLVVDHETDFAEMVAEFLNLQSGIQARWALEPIEVGYHLGRFDPDLLLCAVDMGDGVLGSILQYIDRSSTRLIFMANGRTRENIAVHEEMKGDVLMEKPIKLDTLLQVIQGDSPQTK